MQWQGFEQHARMLVGRMFCFHPTQTANKKTTQSLPLCCVSNRQVFVFLFFLDLLLKYHMHIKKYVSHINVELWWVFVDCIHAGNQHLNQETKQFQYPGCLLNPPCPTPGGSLSWLLAALISLFWFCTLHKSNHYTLLCLALFTQHYTCKIQPHCCEWPTSWT